MSSEALNCSVLIIGAGIAGLMTAHRLQYEYGIDDFYIVEASDRVGGRLHTLEFGDSFVEMGANWINGGSLRNTLFNLANIHSLVDAHPPTAEEWKNRGLFYTSDGQEIDEEVGKRATDAFETLSKQLKSDGKDPNQVPPGTSVQDFMEEKWSSGLESEKERTALEGIFSSRMNQLMVTHGDDLTLVNAAVGDSHQSIRGEDIIVPSGYSSLVEIILKQLKPTRILLETPVQSIHWSEQGVEVKCGNEQTVLAKAAVITVSLGVLKSQGDTLFQPPLPPEKALAIQRLGFGRVAKIFLDFWRPFWTRGMGEMQLAWSKEEILEGSRDPRQWYKAIGAFSEVYNNPHVLMAWLAGPQAEIMEQLEDEEVLITCMNILRRFSGDPTLPKPTSIRRTSWCSNPLFRGTFSYTSMNSTSPEEDRSVLSTPLPENDNLVLLFAGEATHSRYFATAHGAYLSGVREADRIGPTLRRNLEEEQQEKSAKLIHLRSAAARGPTPSF